MKADEINYKFHDQVDRELPKPPGGFETYEQEQEWREKQEKRFMELVLASVEVEVL